VWPGDVGKSKDMYSHLELLSLEKRVLQCFLERGRILEDKARFNTDLAALKAHKVTCDTCVTFDSFVTCDR
jgi:hypothetical protein